jgi:hypothetical protein
VQGKEETKKRQETKVSMQEMPAYLAQGRKIVQAGENVK